MFVRLLQLLATIVLLFGSSVPLAAQVDPRWRSTTDVTDVFKQRSGRSEVLCILDFSGSMANVMWHPYFYTGKDYWTNFGSTSHDSYTRTTANPDDDGTYIRYTLSYDSSTKVYSMGLKVYWAGLNGGTSDTSYPFYNMTGVLVDKDGTVIDQAYLVGKGETANGNVSNSSVGYANTWVKYATHARINTTGVPNFTTSAYKGKTITNGGVTVNRTIDIPVPWKMFDSPDYVENISYNAATGPYPNVPNWVYANYSRTTCLDTKPTTLIPAQSAKTVYLDTTGYVNNDPSQGLAPAMENGGTNVYYGRTSVSGNLRTAGNLDITYNTDYLFWVFFGTNGSPSRKNAASNPTGMTTGLAKYVIPQYNEKNAKGDYATAWRNGLPVKCRFQALKSALISTYYGTLSNGNLVQDAGYWAFRYLDTSENTVSANNDIGGTSNRALRLLSSASGLADLQKKSPGGGTPMTWAVANALAQYNATAILGNGKSIFDPSNNGNQAAAVCGVNLLLLVTDGNPNEDPDPPAAKYYGGYSTSTPNTPYEGNALIQAHRDLVEPGSGTTGNTFWNPETLMGIAAHGSSNEGSTAGSVDGTPITANSSAVGKFLPFQITARGTSSKLPPRPITSITIGLSQGGNLSESGAPQRRLNFGALWGDPSVTGGNTFTADAANPSLAKNFTNADSDEALKQAIISAAEGTTGASGSYTAPSVPFVGTRLGNTTYMGAFVTEKTTRWHGDLLMAGLAMNSTDSSFIDRYGNQTTVLTEDNAIWAASNILAAYKTSDQRKGKVYTYLPGSTTLTVVDPESSTFRNALKAAMPASTQPSDANLTKFLWSMMGGDTSKALTGGAGTYPMFALGGGMGDVINSTPEVVEYPTALAKPYKALSDVLDAAGTATAHFRVIFVSTNLGHVHAFGEVSFNSSMEVTDQAGNKSTVKLPKAAAVELWSFIPTEAILAPWYLDNVDYTGKTNTVQNPHIYLADGSPYVYHGDAPVSVSDSVGNGLIDGKEVALLLFGLGKGGRSYYCLDINNSADPMVPKYKWVIRPDDVSASGGNSVVRTMGLSTCKPTYGRAVNDSKKVTDYVMLGGGFSNADIEGNVGWTTSDPPRPFGHSMIMFDINAGPGNYLTGTGNISSYTDALMGSVQAGAVPFEFYTGSFMTQRVYFSDRVGTIWALGQTGTSGGLRKPDTSLMSDWKLRPVFRTDNKTVISTLPEVFNLPGGVIPQTSTPAVGVSFGTGDRNNPMDFPPKSTDVIPGAIGGVSNNRFCLVFDTNLPTNDASGIAENLLANLTGAKTEAEVLPATYLAPDSSGKPTKFGYYLLLSSALSPYYDKMINQPLVLNNVLFFSVFTPKNDPDQPCGGAGTTTTFRESLVWSPVFNNGNQATTSAYDNTSWFKSSGKVAGATFVNLASDPGAMGNTQILQAGQDETITKGKAGTIIKQMQGKGVPIGMRMRSWRIVR